LDRDRELGGRSLRGQMTEPVPLGPRYGGSALTVTECESLVIMRRTRRGKDQERTLQTPGARVPLFPRRRSSTWGLGGDGRVGTKSSGDRNRHATRRNESLPPESSEGMEEEVSNVLLRPYGQRR